MPSSVDLGGAEEAGTAFVGGFHESFDTASPDKSFQDVPNFCNSSVTSSLIRRTVPTPSYPNEVYSWTALAPARAKSIASAPEVIPPHPMMGIDSGSWERRRDNVLRERGLRGGPDRPPTSSFSAIKIKSIIKRIKRRRIQR